MRERGLIKKIGVRWDVRDKKVGIVSACGDVMMMVERARLREVVQCMRVVSPVID